jgi:hypothetical protein
VNYDQDQGLRRRPDGCGEEEKEIIMTVDSPPTAAREPVGLANSNEIMKTPLCTERYYTSPNRVRPTCRSRALT